MAARKSRKSKATGTRRKRDASGRFLKRKKATAKASPRRAKRRATRAAVKKRAPIRRRKVASTKAPRRRAARRRSTVSPEGSMKRKSPRRRRRAAAREVVAFEAAKPRKKARSRKKAVVHRTPAQRRRRAKTRARKRAPITRALVGWTSGKKRRYLPVKISKRRRPHTTKVRLHRKSKGRSVTRVVYVNESSPRRRAKRRSAKRRSAPRRRSYRRRSHARETMMLNPIGGYGLENPLTGSETFAAVASGAVGYFLNDLLDRWVAHKGATTASGVTDPVQYQAELSGAPNMKRIGAQLVLPVVALFGAPMVKNPMGRSILQGAGIGAGVHLLGQLINTFVMGKFLKDKQFGQTYYPDVIASNNLLSGVAGLPAGVGVGAYTATQLNSATFTPRTAVAFQPLQAGAPMQASAVTGSQSPAASAPPGQSMNFAPSASPPGQSSLMVPSNGGQNISFAQAPSAPQYASNFVPSGPVAVGPTVHPVEGPITGQPCMPCSAETSAAAFRNAYSAARDEIGSCGVGQLSGLNPNMSFPE